jgi:hypothetical protein
MGSCLTLFLGGTTGKSKWRDELIPLLERERLTYFNPIVDDWNDSAREKEYQIKDSPDTVEVYVITNDMIGVFSIAEAVDASNKKPEKTIFMINREGFNTHQLKSLDATSELIQKNGSFIADSLLDITLKFKSIELAHRAKRVSVLARKEKLS